MAKRKTTLEKFLSAKKDYENAVYKTIEDSAKANDISPATYYNYSKKVPEAPKVQISEIKDQGQLEQILQEKTPSPILNIPGMESLPESLLNRIADKIVEKLFAKN